MARQEGGAGSGRQPSGRPRSIPQSRRAKV